jgi:protein arginine N-methyltransferase 5
MEYSTADTSQIEEPATPLYVGQHESQRETAVTLELQAKSQALGYDLLTAPITTSHFQSRVLAKLEEYVAGLPKQIDDSESKSWPEISSFMPDDTDLEPQESNSALIGVVSPWIDLGCKDPLIANISRQVFHLEVAYAAFCGVSNILVPGPLVESDTIGYARVILEGLGLGPYVQLHILMPMSGESELEGTEAAHLSHLARSKYVPEATEDEDDEDEPEPFSTWVTWDTIRNLCHYSTRLSLGKIFQCPPLLCQRCTSTLN